MGDFSQLKDLAAFLADSEEDITSEWERRGRADVHSPVAKTLSRREFRDHIKTILKQLGEVLEGGSVPDTKADALRQHGLERWQHGYELHELLAEWKHLRATILEKSGEFCFPADDATRISMKAAVLICAFLDEASRQSVGRYEQMRKAEAAARVQELEVFKEKLQRMAKQRGQLLREAAHDLRGQLGAVTGAAEELGTFDTSGQEHRALLKSIQEGSEQTLVMLNDLLQLARLDAGHETVSIEEVDIAQCIREVIEGLAPQVHQKGLTLETDLPDKLIVQSDGTMLRRILLNLLTNAVSYTDSGAISISCWGDDRGWRMKVSDSGPGMPEILKAMIEGQPLDDDALRPPNRERTARAGEGVGLSIVKRLTELLAGTIRVNTNREEGTTFEISFPGDPAAKNN